MDQEFDDFDDMNGSDAAVLEDGGDAVQGSTVPGNTVPGSTMFGVAAPGLVLSTDELYAELGYEDVGTLTGGEDTVVARTLVRPSGPDTAARYYGDFALAATYRGIVELPRPVQSLLRISVHEKVADEVMRLLDAWRPHFDLITQIRGYEQRMRQNVPTRFGSLRIAPSSWGLAVTINRQHNKENTPMRLIPFGEPVELTREGKPGYVLYKDHVLVEIAEGLGWAWLGRNKYPNGNPNSYPDPATFAWIRGWQ
jgi:hypothetical protein